MTGVSCRAFGPIVAAAKKGDVSIDELTFGLGLDGVFISNPSNRVSWDDFASIMDRLDQQLGGPAALRQFGETYAENDSFQAFKFVGRVLSRPRDIYKMGALWVGPSLFPMTTAEMIDLGDGRLLQRLTVNEGHRDCPALFHVLHGALATTPQAWGHGYSEVSLELEPRRATYIIRPASPKIGPLGGLIRRVRAHIAFPTMLKELEQQQSEIEASYCELHDAHDKIANQAIDLARVNSIGRRLSEHIALYKVVGVLFDVMVQELGIVGAELSLWLDDFAAEPNRTAAGSDGQSQGSRRWSRHTGIIEGDPDARYLLEAGSHPLGTLSVWRHRPDHPAVNHALLERLIPWIAMALDNARTYQGLKRHAAALEQRVDERTARLLAANHHLVREIEERQRATDALMESEAQLHASERLASIGTLAAGIAHEINNPIGSILAAAQLAQLVRSDGDGDAQVSASLETIVEQTKRCGEIVRSVLQFSRNEPTQKWVSKINDVVARSIKLTEGFALEHQARTHFDIPALTVWAKINPIQIEQAVVNLIRNAIESGAKQINVNLDGHRPGGFATIQVRDNGPGVEDSDRLRIFDPFYTTKQNVGGTGLGLSVVHGIAVEHGGSLKIAATRDPGTTIRFILPTCPAPANPLAEKPDDPDRPAG